MGPICRLIFVIMFLPTCLVSFIFDLIMFIAIGDKHESYKVLDIYSYTSHLKPMLATP